MSKKALSRLVVGVTISTGAVLGFVYWYFKRHREVKEAEDEKKKNKKSVNFSETETVFNKTVNSCESSVGKERPAEILKPVLEAAKNEENKIEHNDKSTIPEGSKGHQITNHGPKPEDKSTTMEMTIPKDVVAGVIGKKGYNIKKIQRESNTQINFKDETLENGDRLCVIRGRADDVNLAQNMIKTYVASQPVLTTKEILVPYNTVGRIIGRSGETIRGMQDMSKAKIIVDSGRTEVQPDEGEIFSVVTLKGTQDQINMAERLIFEKVDEEKQLKNRIKSLTTTRTPRRVNSAASNSSTPTKNGSVEAEIGKSTLRTEGISEVLVSCVYHPNMFWIQIVGQDSIELDKLADSMNDYYGNENPRESYSKSEADFQVGDIVASPFQDEKMYRARITSISDDGKVAEVEYVDYGDRREIEVQHLRTLLPSFLGLKFQAIEATLNLTCAESKWPDDAITRFCDLSYCAQWKALTAKVKGYLNEGEPRKRKIVWLDLMDKDVNLAQVLKSDGFAITEGGRKDGERNRKLSGNAHYEMSS